MILILNLTFTNPENGALDMLVIDDELATVSDHHVLVHDVANTEGEAGSMSTSEEVTGWEVKTMSKYSRKGIAIVWHTAPIGRNILGEYSTPEEVEHEARWMEVSLTTTLDSHLTLLRVRARSN